MTSSTTRRGRPKGSGIDDRAMLRRIDDMLEADPALRPTTAIKAMGVTDPSAIRRLRDKLKAGEHHLHPELQPVRPAIGGGAPTQLALFEASSRLRTGSAPRATSHGGAVSQVPMASPGEAEFRWLLSLYALGLSAFSSTVEAQISLMEGFFHVPQVACALRHQLLVNEVAKSFCPKRPGVRPTLH